MIQQTTNNYYAQNSQQTPYYIPIMSTQSQSQKKYKNIDNKNTYQYYRKSERDKNGRFDLRFKQIRNSLVDTSNWQTLKALISWRLYQKNQSWPNDKIKLQQQLPMQIPKFSRDENKIVYTWIGHSTAILSIGKQLNIIIDPVFSQRASPNQWIGPLRFRQPACKIQDQIFPKIDVVLVSHDHYDHLDEEALNKLYKKNKDTIFIAGLQSKDVFPKGCNFVQLDWTETKSIQIPNSKQKINVTFVPVCHWGRRGAFDKNKRLWGGFVVETGRGKRIFYSGDTGKCGVFQEIGKQFKQFDLSILPIGAYEPRKYLANQHVNPQQAVQIHKQINSKKSVGVHWGTFPLGFQHYCGARKDLQIAVEKYELKKDQFITVNHGGQFSIDY